jgi:hypothetical protein
MSCVRIGVEPVDVLGDGDPEVAGVLLDPRCRTDLTATGE